MLPVNWGLVAIMVGGLQGMLPVNCGLVAIMVGGLQGMLPVNWGLVAIMVGGLQGMLPVNSFPSTISLMTIKIYYVNWNAAQLR